MAFTYNGNNAPEYNVNGDTANGRNGSYTNGAVTNRMQQPQRSGGNPYGEILNYVNSVKTVPGQPGGYNGAPPGMPGGYSGVPGGYGGGTLGQTPVVGTPIGQPGGYNGAPPGMAPGLGDQPGLMPGQVGTQPGLDQTGGFGGSGLGGAKVVNTAINPALAKGHAVGSGNSNPINPRTGKPLAMAVPQGVDPNLWNEVDSWVQGGYAKGADYSFLYQHPQWVMDFRQWQQKYDPKSTVDPVDWLAHVHPEMNHQLQGRSGGDTMDAFLKAHPDFNPDGTPKGAPQQAPPFTPDLKNYINTIMQQYGPLFGQQRTDLSNTLAGQGALTGDLNSGGYMDVLGRQENRLAAQQGGQVGDALQQELNRQYQAWAQANNYNLGVAGLGLQQYFHDNPSFTDLMQWYLSLSPEQMSMMGITGIPWQNFVLTH